MAWICYYIGLSHALVAVAACAYIRWGDTRASGIHDKHEPMPRCCVAARVRRSTAAKGQ